MEQKKEQLKNRGYRFVQTWWPWLLNIGAIVLIIAIVCALGGCTTPKTVTKEVPVTVERIHHDTLEVTRWRTDTCIMRDSVVVTQTGVDRWQTRYVMRTRTDTVYRTRIDTVPKVVTVTKETVKKESKALGWRMWAAIGVIVAAGAVAVLWRD